MAVTKFYVDGDNGDDANDGSSWALAKKTIWQAIVECVENDTALGDGIIFEISGGHSGITYFETHNLILSEAAGTYTGDTPSISTTTGVPDGTAIAPIIFTGSTDFGKNGLVTIDHSLMTNYRAYEAAVSSRCEYSRLRRFEVINAPDATKDDVNIQFGGDNSIVEDVFTPAYWSHGIQVVDADDCIVRRNHVYSRTDESTSSGIKVGSNSLNALVHHNHVKDSGGNGAALHFCIYAAGGTGHKFLNNDASGSTGPGMGVTNSGVIDEYYGNASHGNAKHALMIEAGSSVTASDNNTIHRASGGVVGLISAFSTVDATYDANITNDYSLLQWQATGGTPDLSSVDTVPDSAGINSSMPRPESDQYESGDNTPLATESITTDILGAAINGTPNMGAYQTRYYMPTEQAKPAIVQPFYKGKFVLPVILG